MIMPANYASKKILLVEDEPIICYICIRTLKEEGLKVDVAENGRVAQQNISETNYDLALVDIRTPLMNGKDLYEYIKNNKPGLEEKIIFTTGDTMGDDTSAFLAKAGRPYLAKPFTPAELKEIVKKHFGV